MKAIIITLSLVVSFLTYGMIRQQAYAVDSAAYFEYLAAVHEYEKEYNRFTFCGLVWEMRKKQEVPLFTNCYTTHDDLINAVRGKKADKFGTSIFQSQDIYAQLMNAQVEYEYMKEHKYLIAVKSLFFIDHDPGPLLSLDQMPKKCKYKGEVIDVWNTYNYGYWTSEGSIMIPEAHKVTDCKVEE